MLQLKREKSCILSWVRESLHILPLAVKVRDSISRDVSMALSAFNQPGLERGISSRAEQGKYMTTRARSFENAGE